MGSSSNGIQLASQLALQYLVTQCLPGFAHQGEPLGSPFLDARLHPMRADGVDEQGASRHPGVRGAELSQGIQKADPFHPVCWSMADWHMTRRTRL
jgi:hypothetical protein